MAIRRLKIKNFKCFSGWFSIEFENKINVLVGNNGSGKTTILEAINLGLTGLYHGKNIKNELSQYLFNNEVVKDYLNKINNQQIVELPDIVIEIYFEDEIPSFLGNNNSEENNDVSGVYLTISFDKKYTEEYKIFCESLGEKTSIPIEYYEVNWMSFSRENITTRSMPIKSAMIDTNSYTSNVGTDIYISRILKNILEEREIVNISQSHRIMKESFSRNSAIEDINKKLKGISKHDLKLSVDFGNKNSWESSLATQLNGVPYNNIGKGNQCIIKTGLALSDKKNENKDILLFEEPECHLSHTNLNILLNDIESSKNNKQIIITTHSSFVSNKLGLKNLILLNCGNVIRLCDLSEETWKFFKRISGYDTLRIVLSSKVILVEGDSDELIVQRAYMDNNSGKLPIYDGIDVISIGTSFLRFLEIAKILNLKMAVITDNDGDIEKLKRKYNEYLLEKNIKIFFDQKEYSGEKENYNYNTLEPCIYRENSIQSLNKILKKEFQNEQDLLEYMRNNKTKVALEIFENEEKIKYPQYIIEGISNEW